MVNQWAAMISAGLAILAIGIFTVYIRFANIDATETRLLLMYWKEMSLLTVWLLLSIFWFKRVS